MSKQDGTLNAFESRVCRFITLLAETRDSEKTKKLEMELSIVKKKLEHIESSVVMCHIKGCNNIVNCDYCKHDGYKRCYQCYCYTCVDHRLICKDDRAWICTDCDTYECDVCRKKLSSVSDKKIECANCTSLICQTCFNDTCHWCKIQLSDSFLCNDCIMIHNDDVCDNCQAKLFVPSCEKCAPDICACSKCINRDAIFCCKCIKNH